MASELEDRLIKFARLAGVIAVLVGALVVCGWFLDVPLLRSLSPGFPEMKFNSAAAFVLTGVSLWLLTKEGRLYALAGRVCAAAVAVLALLTLGEYLFGLDLGIDERFIADDGGEGDYPGRIPLTVTVNFLLAGTALSLLGIPNLKSIWPVQAAAVTIIVIAVTIILTFAYDVSSFYRPATGNPIALHGMIVFLLLGLGVLFARPDRGLMIWATSPDAGGILIRRLLPACVLIPPTVGWLRLQGEQAQLYTVEVGLALFATTNVAILSSLIWYTAGDVRRSDRMRRAAESKVQAQLSRLGLLNHITHAIGERHDLRSVFQVVVRSLEDNLGVEFSCIGLYDRASQTISVEAVGIRSRPLAQDLAIPENARIAIDTNGLSRCVEGALVYEPDIQPLAFPFPQRLARGGLRALVIAPLATESMVFGVLIVARRESSSFSSTDCEFLRQLSEHVALATRHAQLYGALQRAYDDLHQSQQTAVQQERLRALGQLSSGIAHDINNALSPAALYTDLILETENQISQDGRQWLATVRRAIDDVTQTVARMKYFYAQREPQVQLAAVDINACIQQVTDLTRPRWRDQPQHRGIAIDLKLDLSPAPATVMGAESEIRDALINLVFNAVDAMPNGGALTIRSRTDKTENGPHATATVDVSDTGIGMDEETRRRSLEPFFTTKGERGSGLGLAMVYGMAKRHGADLDIESTVGQGTTVRLTFVAATATSMAARPAGAPAGPVQRLRVLLIDDDPILLQSLNDALKYDGHVVTLADGGQAGINAFQAAQRKGEPFSIVITDLGMPYVDGRNVAAAIRLSSPSTPIILLTGWGQRLRHDNPTPPNVDRVLAKPPNIRELRATLAELTTPASVH